MPFARPIGIRIRDDLGNDSYKCSADQIGVRIGTEGGFGIKPAWIGAIEICPTSGQLCARGASFWDYMPSLSPPLSLGFTAQQWRL